MQQTNNFIDLHSLSNAFYRIGEQWMLLGAGNIDHFNMMTASWGGFGILWHKPVVFVFVRPQRYTYQFIDKNDTFFLSFFEEAYRDVLNVCGSKSGRDINKMSDAGITPYPVSENAVGFKEATYNVVCEKIYYDDLDPSRILSQDAMKHYIKGDFHRMYVGEVKHIETRESDQESI